MKKYILILFGIGMFLPAFAFDFNKDNLGIDANLKSEIETTLIPEINNIAEENIKVKDIEQNSDNEVILLIEKEMNLTLKRINRNTKLRKNIFTRSFVKEQEIQKERYQNMIKWNIPYQIYEYIGMNFDLTKIEKPTAMCIYHNETLVEVRFNFLSYFIIVYYDYNDKDHPIKHVIN